MASLWAAASRASGWHWPILALAMVALLALAMVAMAGIDVPRDVGSWRWSPLRLV